MRTRVTEQPREQPRSQSAPLLELRDVSRQFGRSPDVAQRVANYLRGSRIATLVRAVDHVSLAIATGEVLGLVGESGCGKSTLGRLAAGLIAPTSGTRVWKGIELDRLPADQRRKHSLAIQMIFQDAHASLNPRMRVADLVGEAPVAHGMVAKKDRDAHVVASLERVGLDASALRRYPHQFSGGQRARVGIARALAVAPEFLVCDEAVAALDVSIQAQVLNLFLRLRDELHLTYLFISHDLGVVRHVSDRVVIMYLGRVVESAATRELFAAPNHPYTQGLIAEAPSLAVKKKTYIAIQGEIPSPLSPPSGCHFHPRCPRAASVPGSRCSLEQPALREIVPGRWSACHLNDL